MRKTSLDLLRLTRMHCATLLVGVAIGVCCMGVAGAQSSTGIAPDDTARMAQSASMKTDTGLTTLATATPEEGFALAIKLSQKAVGAVQKDVAVRKALRPAYAHDANSLIAVSHVVAVHFQTIAAANNYWRE